MVSSENREIFLVCWGQNELKMFVFVLTVVLNVMDSELIRNEFDSLSNFDGNIRVRNEAS
jgi:hypothetical protein